MVKIAILGFGTVGSGVAEVIDMNKENIARTTMQDIELKYIVDIRDFKDNPYEKYIIKDFDVVEKDPEVKIVVETIGGKGVAYEFTKRSLLAGKSVVTSNKELVATHGCELMKIAKENGVNYMFEAAVGGGIPVIRPLFRCLAANNINEICGILNGTTNYILTEMIENGTTFEEALKQAQRNGYAEANPAADIEGHDACRKICILSSICMRHHVFPEQVPTEGISNIDLEDVRIAEEHGYRIKLIGRALFNGGKAAIYVAPHLITEKRLLSRVDGVMNGVMVNGNAVGEVMFYGAGAGKLPTASAVVADVMDEAMHIGRDKQMSWEEGGPEYVSDPELIVSRWYVRLDKFSADGKAVFGTGNEIADGVFMTIPMDKKQITDKIKDLKVSVMFRILD